MTPGFFLLVKWTGQQGEPDRFSQRRAREQSVTSQHGFVAASVIVLLYTHLECHEVPWHRVVRARSREGNRIINLTKVGHNFIVAVQPLVQKNF